MNRKYPVYFLLTLLSLAAVFTSTAHAATAFSFNDTFAIPSCNSQIRFATGGSYRSASLVGNAWVFSGLSFDAVHMTDFTVSAKDCNVTITGISAINMPDQIGWVTYNVTGVGSQTLGVSNLAGDVYGFVSEYVVFIDGVNRTEGDGWTFRPFTITGATTNVSIGYTGIYSPVTLEPPSASESPSPTSTAFPTPAVFSTPSAENQPQGQVIYTVAIVGVVLAVVAIAFVIKSHLHPRIKR